MTHLFNAVATGGTQRVVADGRRDHDQISLIREHLREEATAFQRGNLADPAAIHVASARHRDDATPARVVRQERASGAVRPATDGTPAACWW